MTGFEIKAILAALAIALGITAPLPDFLGGMLIAVGCSYGVMIVSEPANRLSVWSTLFLAVLAAVLFAVLHKHIAVLAGLPLQAIMGAAGGLSKFLTEATIGFGKNAKDRISDIPNKIKLPGEK
jgi:hypothetical protein